MVKKLNNKGYMLVEIILAFVLAFGVMYYMLELAIKIKNKNDDLLVETLTATDQAIISNKLTQMFKENNFDCTKLTVDNGKKIKYNSEVIDIVNDYATADINSCASSGEEIKVNIGLTVKQMPDKNFDVNLTYVK